MDVIYNEEKALKSKALYEKKCRQARCVVAGLAVLSFLSMITLVLLLSTSLLPESFSWIGTPALLVMLLSLSMLIGATLGELFKPSMPTDVTYYMAVQNKKVLDVRVMVRSNEYIEAKWIYLITENSDGDVIQTPLCPYIVQLNTKIQKPAFDAHKGVCWIPFENPDKFKREN